MLNTLKVFKIKKLIITTILVIFVSVPAMAKSSKDYDEIGFRSLNYQDYENAIPNFLAAIELDSRDWKAYQYLGDAYNHINLMKEAFEAYENSLRINPKNQALREFVADLRVKNALAPIEHKIKQETGNLEFSVNASYSRLGKVIDDKVWPQGLGLGIWAGYQIDPRITVGAKLHYIVFNANNVQLANRYMPPYAYAQFSGGTGALQFWYIIPSVKINFITDKDYPVHPYFMAGLGLMNTSIEQVNISGKNYSGIPVGAIVPGYSETVQALSGAVGMPIRLSDGFNIPIEVGFSIGFTPNENTTLTTLSVGIEREW